MIASNRVYPICVRVGVILAADFSTASETGCGTYHTYEASSEFTGNIDRNFGNFVSTKNQASTNTYNFTFYSSLYGNFVTGKINAAYVAWSAGTTIDFGIWTVIQIGDNAEKIDFIGQQVDLKSTDSYQSGSAITTQVPDNSTGTPAGCTNNMVRISAGKGSTSTNLYQYHHVSRDLVVTDVFCDNQLITNTTKICTAYKDGTSTLTNFIDAAEGRSCTTFVFVKTMMWTFSVMLALVMIH